MKPFVFSLEKMHTYKEQMLTKEKNALAQLNKKKLDIENSVVNLGQYRASQKQQLQKQQQVGMTAKEMSSFTFMLNNTKYQLDDCAKQIQFMDEKIAIQLKKVIAISQEISGLEKLEEKQREEYNKLANKEEQTQILEHVITSMTKKKKEQNEENGED